MRYYVRIAGLKSRRETSGARRSWRWAQRGHGHSARDVQEGVKRDVRDVIKLERIGVIEEQRWTKHERGRRYPNECDPQGEGRKSGAEGLDFAGERGSKLRKGETTWVTVCQHVHDECQ
jgi:hypothetical protein